MDDQRDGPVPDEQTETVLDSDTTDRPTEPVPQTGLERDCRVNSFQLQPNFNLARFQGYWYSMSITRYWMAIPSWLPVRQANVQINYKLQSDGTIQLLTGGQFVYSFCDYIIGKGIIPDKSHPEKMEAQFDTMVSRASRKTPNWVVSTDYEGYAVIYSCWKEREDGTCNPDYAYMWTLNRKQSGHTPEQEVEIKRAAERMCVPSENFKTFEQDGNCKFNPDKFPAGGLGLIPFLIIASLMIVLLGILLYMCVSKGDNKSTLMKKTQ